LLWNECEMRRTVAVLYQLTSALLQNEPVCILTAKWLHSGMQHLPNHWTIQMCDLTKPLLLEGFAKPTSTPLRHLCRSQRPPQLARTQFSGLYDVDWQELPVNNMLVIVPQATHWGPGPRHAIAGAPWRRVLDPFFPCDIRCLFPSTNNGRQNQYIRDVLLDSRSRTCCADTELSWC